MREIKTEKFFYNGKYFKTMEEFENEVIRFANEPITEEELKYRINTFLIEDLWVNWEKPPTGNQLLKFLEKAFELGMKDSLDWSKE